MASGGRTASAATTGTSARTLRGGAVPKRTAARAKDWTAHMVEQFVEMLADSCNVTLAAKAIGRSPGSVYRHRERDATFRRQWMQAVAIGYSRLELMLLERALHGVEKVIVLKDGGQSVMREYDNRTALALLRLHRDGVAAAEQPIAEQEYVEARDRIMARIERIRARKGIKVEKKGCSSQVRCNGKYFTTRHSSRSICFLRGQWTEYRSRFRLPVRRLAVFIAWIPVRAARSQAMNRN
jgi:hypothetical protein